MNCDENQPLRCLPEDLSWAPEPFEGDHKNIAKPAEICHLRADFDARSFAMFHPVPAFLGASLGASPHFWVESRKSEAPKTC